MFPAASDTGPQGFVRVINHSAEAGEVRVDVFDETGEAFGPLTLALGANETKHFNSHDLERGNRDKGLRGSAGSGAEAWRLELSSAPNIEVLSYLRTPDGFLTAMQDVAPGIDRRHRVAIFNPGSNRSQRSILRLVNPGMATAQVTIEGVDDRGAFAGGSCGLAQMRQDLHRRDRGPGRHAHLARERTRQRSAAGRQLRREPERRPLRHDERP